jgi:hypothetical protein
MDPFLCDALARLDGWLLEVCNREELRSQRLTPRGVAGWDAVRALTRPAVTDLLFDEGGSEPGLLAPLTGAAEHPLARVTQALGLSPVSAEVLLVLLAPHVEPRYRSVYGVLQDNLQQFGTTERLLLTVLGRSAERRRDLQQALASSSALLAGGLVVASEDAGLDRPTAPLVCTT